MKNDITIVKIIIRIKSYGTSDQRLIYTTSFIVSSKLKLLFIIKIMIERHESKWKKKNQANLTNLFLRVFYFPSPHTIYTPTLFTMNNELLKNRRVISIINSMCFHKIMVE